MRRCLALAALSIWAALCLAPHAAIAQPPARLALVLGNVHYGRIGTLENAGHDAADMGATLKSLGYTVVSIVDLDLAKLDAALAGFSGKIAPGDTVVVYYAGHGVMGLASSGGQAMDNYLVPIDARFAVPNAVPAESVALGRVLEALERAHAGARILILDACRNNPFAPYWAQMTTGTEGPPTAGGGPSVPVVIWAQ